MLRLFALTFIAFACSALIGAQVPSSCPRISVYGPAGITQPGEKFSFTGSVEGDVPKNVSFQWEVSGGKIVESQGTLKLLADADWSLGGATVTAALSVVGLPEGCPKSASETAGVTGPHSPILIDEFERLANAAVRPRLNNLIAELKRYPNNQGYIILYGTEKEIAARERLILRSVNFRRFPTERITMVRAGLHESGRAYTRLFRIPPGAENPVP